MNRILRSAVLSLGVAGALSGLAACGADEPGTSTAQAVAPVATATAPTAVAVVPDRQVGLPTRLEIPAIAVDERLHGVGLKPDGAMRTPDFGDAGWYDLGPRPGAAGPSVIVAHVHGPAGDDVFARLHELTPGAVVRVRRTDGVGVFVVDSVESARKEALPYHRIWTTSDRPVLRLITCGGKPDPVTRVYPENTIVYARLVR